MLKGYVPIDENKLTKSHNKTPSRCHYIWRTRRRLQNSETPITYPAKFGKKIDVMWPCIMWPIHTLSLNNIFILSGSQDCCDCGSFGCCCRILKIDEWRRVRTSTRNKHPSKLRGRKAARHPAADGTSTGTALWRGLWRVLDRPIGDIGGTFTSAFESIKKQPNRLKASGQGDSSNDISHRCSFFACRYVRVFWLLVPFRQSLSAAVALPKACKTASQYDVWLLLGGTCTKKVRGGRTKSWPTDWSRYRNARHNKTNTGMADVLKQILERQKEMTTNKSAIITSIKSFV